MKSVIPLTERQRVLVTAEAVRHAEVIARSYLRRVPPHCRDDVLSAAYLGLTLAAQRYDLARGVGFLTYCTFRVRGEITDALRRGGVKGFRVRSGRAAVVAPSFVRVGDGSGRNEIDPVGADLPVGWELESEDAVRVAAERLPSWEGRFLREYFLRADGTLKSIGRRHGCCESAASMVVRRAVELLQSEESGKGGVCGT